MITHSIISTPTVEIILKGPWNFASSFFDARVVFILTHLDILGLLVGIAMKV
jgi:hypothetical protein